MFNYQINTKLSELEVLEKLNLHCEDSNVKIPGVEIFFQKQDGIATNLLTLRRLTDYSINDRFGPEIVINSSNFGDNTRVQIQFIISNSDKKSGLFILLWNATFLFIWGYFFEFVLPSPYVYPVLGGILGFGLLFSFLTFYSKCSGNLSLIKRILQAED